MKIQGAGIMPPLEASRLLLSMVMLGYASWKDLKTREISDITWIVFGLPAVAINIYQFIVGEIALTEIAVPVLFSTALSFVLSYAGLFGGADFFAFVVLALLQPRKPIMVTPVLGVVSIIYPLTVFSNSALAGAFMAIAILIRNLTTARGPRLLFENHPSESRLKKLIIMVSGMKVRIDEVRGPPFQYPLEEPGSTGRRLIAMPNMGDDEAAIKTFEALRSEGVEWIWVSHTLPFIVFVTIGFTTSMLFGDITLWLISRLFNIF